MYFTDDKKLQRFEREMKIVPNFERKEVWEFVDICNECKNYKCKLESCMEAHCPYLKRKITAKIQEEYHQTPKEFCESTFDESIKIGGI